MTFLLNMTFMKNVFYEIFLFLWNMTLMIFFFAHLPPSVQHDIPGGQVPVSDRHGLEGLHAARNLNDTNVEE